MMLELFYRIKVRAGVYFRATEGAVAVAFGLAIPVIVCAVGLTVDMAQAYMVRERLARAIDASALAGAATADDEAAITAKVEDFFEANFPEEKIGTAYDLHVALNGDEVEVSARAEVDTTFMRIFGYDHINIYEEAVIARQVLGLEVVLVLDNTGSMATNNNITALKNATTSFINIMFDHTDDPNHVRIGMVPYSNSVRIGRYGLGMKPDGSAYSDGSVFVTLPSGVSYTTNHSSITGWYGCVIEHKGPGYSATGTHVNNSYGQLWRSGTNWKGHGWDPAISNNDPYPQDVTDNYAGPWDIYMYGRIRTNGQSGCSSTYCFSKSSEPNQGCPYAYILPLTSSQQELLSRVSDMQPEGNTNGAAGMMWAYRLISPEPPFIEGKAWDSEKWRKAIVMMTDGDNTIDSGSTGYSYYWTGSQNNMTVTKMNNRFAEICETLKEEHDVLIYTVTFYSNINEDTKDYYRQCATNESMYYDAPSQADLIEVFEKISRELSNLHIKQ